MNYPMLEINLPKITGNAKAIVDLCSKNGIQVCAVVKSVCGSPEIVRSVLACGGIRQIGDSRIVNFDRLRNDGVDAEFMMLRIPMLSQCPKIVSMCDYSLNSEIPVISALAREAGKTGRTHKIILMIDAGDLREGILPEDAPCIAEQITEMPGVKLVGAGVNLSCYGGVKPTEKNLTLLVECVENIEKRLGRNLEIISGGNSSSLPLLISGKMPSRINHLRIGEGILLGRDTLECKALPGTYQDAFIFKTEVIEAGRKPSAPIGEIVRDAFGRCPKFENRGIRRRAILGAGRQDIVPEALKPFAAKAEILGASSDHLLLDIDDCGNEINTGDIMSFRLEYSALLSAMTSVYVNKEFINNVSREGKNKSIRIIYAPTSTGANMPGAELAPKLLVKCGLIPQLKNLGFEIEHYPDSLNNKFIYSKERSFDEKIKLTENINKNVSGEIIQCLGQNKFPLLLGGDHTVTIAAATALTKHRDKNDETGLILFGAFANFNSARTSTSGNLHGLTLDACTNGKNILHIMGSKNIPQKNVALIGLRDLDSKERERLRKSQINTFTMEKIDFLGIRETITQILHKLCHCRNGVHLSFSMDVLSPEFAPGVSLPVDNGLNIREAHLSLEMIHASGLLASADFVEYNPRRDMQSATGKLAVNLICTLFGKTIV